LRPKVTGGVTATSLGDDACPFVTYYTPVRGQGIYLFKIWVSISRDPSKFSLIIPIYGGNGPYEPFGMPNLEDWSNSGGSVDFVDARGGQANAVRIDGGLNITIGTIFAHGMFPFPPSLAFNLTIAQE
jgi:hypothetical protein